MFVDPYKLKKAASVAWRATVVLGIILAIPVFIILYARFDSPEAPLWVDQVAGSIVLGFILALSGWFGVFFTSGCVILLFHRRFHGGMGEWLLLSRGKIALMMAFLIYGAVLSWAVFEREFLQLIQLWRQ